MASIDYCLTILENGEKLMQEYANRLTITRKKLSTYTPISLETINKTKENAVFDVDNSKLLLSCKQSPISGKALYQLLQNKYHLQCEMYMGSYVLAMTSCMDTEEGFSRLLSAVKEINQKSVPQIKSNLRHSNSFFQLQQFRLKTILSIAESEHYSSTQIPIEEAQDKISAEFIYLYPPGIPFVVPGECFSKEILQQILWYQTHGFEILGIEKGKLKIINLSL